MGKITSKIHIFVKQFLVTYDIITTIVLSLDGGKRGVRIKQEGAERMNKKVFAAVAATAVLSVSMLFQAAASGGDPGSSTDPLVTKSYVDQSISNLMTALSGSASTGTGAMPVYEPVQLVYGQRLQGGEGAEIIMRSGSGRCFSAVESGLVDVTGGREIFDGQTVEQNHMLIVSRADGRGVEVTSDDAWFIVRGSYTIE